MLLILTLLPQNDKTLDPSNRYFQLCGLKSGSQTSLVKIEFGFFPEIVPNSQPVPDNTDCYYLNARMSKIRVVLLYRFIQEFIQYLSTMLLLRPHDEIMINSDDQKESNNCDSSTEYNNDIVAPFVMAMDVFMDAPEISLPRSSRSDEYIKADLGKLQLKSKVRLFNIKTDKVNDSGNFMELASLKLSDLDCRLCSADIEGKSVIKQSGHSWGLTWERPLLPMKDISIPEVIFILGRCVLKAFFYMITISCSLP